MMPSVKARQAMSALVVGAASVAPGACSDDDDDGGASSVVPAVSAAALDGRMFASTEVEGATLVDGTEITVAFRQGSVMANAGCNTIGGAYTVVDSRLVVEDVGQTAMGCAEDLHRQEDWLLTFLDGDPSVSLENDVLTLSDDSVTIVAAELGGSGG